MKKSDYRRNLAAILMSAFCLLGLTSCNLYGGIDSPSGDTQLASAARACLDQGNFSCANNYYNQLSSNSNDIKQSELAYSDMEQAGIGFQQFAAAFGTGVGINIGSAMTNLANAIIPLGPGAALRVRLYNDFAHETTISDPNIKALVKFLAGISFAAEILAEAAVSAGNTQLLKTDIATNPANCISSSGAACGQPAGTTVTATGTVVQLADGNTSLDQEATQNPGSTTNISSPNVKVLNMFMVSLSDLNSALTQLGQSGALGSNFSTFISTFGSVASDGTVRFVLLSDGIGN